MGCCDVGEEGIVWKEKDRSTAQVWSVKQGSLWGGKDVEGREGRGNVVGPSGEGIGFVLE